MADGGEDIFLFGDDFDVILDLLEQDEDIEEEFVTSVENVSIICLVFKWNLLKNAKTSSREASALVLTNWNISYCIITFRFFGRLK